MIPARLSSTRLARKVLLDLKGKPMIQRVYERACQSSIDEIYITTDSIQIQEAASLFTEKIIMTSSKHKSGSDRVSEAAQKIECDYIINLQADEPLIDSTLLNSLDKKLREQNFEMVTAAYPMSSKKEIEDTSKVKVVLDSESRAIYFSRSPIPYHKTFETNYFCHLGVYGFTKNFLSWFAQMGESKLEKAESLEQLRVLYFGKQIYVMTTKKNFPSIDKAEDIEKILKAL